MQSATPGILQPETICIAMSSVRAIRIRQDSDRHSNEIFWTKKWLAGNRASQGGVLQGENNFNYSK
jgi:hypothetical protein